MLEETRTIGEQILEALDGRTRRWLSMKIGVHESDLSKKMNGKVEFTPTEIERVNLALGCEIAISREKTN